MSIRSEVKGRSQLSSEPILCRSSKSGSPVKSVRKEKSRSEEPEDQLEGGQCASDEKLCIALTHQVG